jgi:hypothetical protein
VVEADEEADEFVYDEEELPDELRRLLKAPSKGLNELLREAKIDFSDPDLMDDDLGAYGSSFRAGAGACLRALPL